MLIAETLHSHGEGRAALLVFMGIRGYQWHGISTQPYIKEVHMSVYTWISLRTLPCITTYHVPLNHTSGKHHWE